jgi:hypothetical protein
MLPIYILHLCERQDHCFLCRSKFPAIVIYTLITANASTAVRLTPVTEDISPLLRNINTVMVTLSEGRPANNSLHYEST